MSEYMCCKIINDWEFLRASCSSIQFIQDRHPHLVIAALGNKYRVLTVEEISTWQTGYVLLQIFGSRSGNRGLPESSVRLCFIFNQRVILDEYEVFRHRQVKSLHPPS